MFWINYGISNTLTGAKQLSASFNPDLEITAVQHTFPTTFTEAYTYDPRGNRLASLSNTFAYNDLNQLLESATHTYAYDADGNLVQERNKTSGETKKYFYNSENRLTGYEHYANEFTSVDQIAQYTYDLYGRRIQKTVNGMVTNFLWDEDNISLEYNDNNQPCQEALISTHWIGANSGGVGDSLGVEGEGRRLLSIAIRVSFPLGNGQAWEAAPGEGRLTPCRVWAVGHRRTGGHCGKRACDKTVLRCPGK